MTGTRWLGLDAGWCVAGEEWQNSATRFAGRVYALTGPSRCRRHRRRYHVYQWRVSPVVLVYGLHRLDVWSCQECWRQAASGASASTVPQCGTACRLLCATTVFHWTRSRGCCLDSNAHHPARCGVLWLAPSINVMTYWLTYLLTYKIERLAVFSEHCVSITRCCFCCAWNNLVRIAVYISTNSKTLTNAQRMIILISYHVLPIKLVFAIVEQFCECRNGQWNFWKLGPLWVRH